MNCIYVVGIFVVVVLFSWDFVGKFVIVVDDVVEILVVLLSLKVVGIFVVDVSWEFLLVCFRRIHEEMVLLLFWEVS